MSRVKLPVNVGDLDAAVAFYPRLLGAEPARLRPGYANFALDDPPLKLVLNAPGNGPGGTINHLGAEVGSTPEAGQAEAGLAASVWPPSPSLARRAATRGRTRCGSAILTGWPGGTTPVLEHVETS